MDYKEAGVNIEAGYEAVKLMKKHVQSTYNSGVMGDIGSFGGCYKLDERPDGDVLVAGTDGVGTKLKYAFISGRHDTIGVDAVAMCVNDVVALGAKPLFFLDYIAISKLVPEKVASIVAGVCEGCRQAGAALIGGETAEMPGFYREDEYDIAGFAVGVVKKDKIIDGSKIKEGDALIGLPSTGIHSNGFSLVRKIFGEDKEVLSQYNDRLGAVLCDALLTPTRIYVKTVLGILEKYEIKGIAHITGGGFIENIPRMLPKGLAAKIDFSSYEVPEIFKLMQEKSGISREKMYNTFNMGIGLVLAVDKKDAEGVIAAARTFGDEAVLLGKVVAGEGVVL